MTIAELCLLGMVLLTHVVLMPVKLLGRRSFSNAAPRDPGFYTPGLRTRALGAHQNGWEAFPLFATSVLLAEFRHVPQGAVDGLAVAYLVARVGYAACYLGDRPSLRSAVWTVALLCNLAIFLLPVLVGSAP
jgi:uncharacterized MAPEG superfamily protein